MTLDALPSLVTWLVALVALLPLVGWVTVVAACDVVVSSDVSVVTFAEFMVVLVLTVAVCVKTSDVERLSTVDNSASVVAFVVISVT